MIRAQAALSRGPSWSPARMWQACCALAVTAALGALLLGCRQGPPVAEEPIWNKQPCAHCAMLLSHKPSAAQAISATGDRAFFDDLGCLVAWQQAQKAAPEALWTRAGASWLPAQEARYRSGATTPMDFGYEQAATGTASWDDVKAAVSARLAAPVDYGQ